LRAIQLSKSTYSYKIVIHSVNYRSLGSTDIDKNLESNSYIGEEKQTEEPTKEKSTKKEHLIACYSTATSGTLVILTLNI
jgi:hypothetical protein